jgi:multicomponent K+:H+ antiporter subunit A
VVAGALAVAYSIRFVHDVFFNGEPVDLPRHAARAAALDALSRSSCWWCCACCRRRAAVLRRRISTPRPARCCPEPLPYFTLAVWHGFDLPLA